MHSIPLPGLEKSHVSVVEKFHDTAVWTAVDLVKRFGPIPLSRVRHDPLPGTATETDLVRIHDREGRLYELVDGALVEKIMGTYESLLAVRICAKIYAFVDERDLGIVLGEAGMMRFAPGLVRIPDVSFISARRMQGIDLSAQAIADLVPDLAIEIISGGNTSEEMTVKLREYFSKGVRMAWYVYPKTEEVLVYREPEHCRVFTFEDTLSGEEVLPGFTLRLSAIFKK